jgi:hypothetical protein
VSAPVTRVTLFVPGMPGSLRAWSSVLRESGLGVERGALGGEGVTSRIDVEWVENDGAFGTAFSFGTVAPEVVAAVDVAPGALVLRSTIDLRAGRQELVLVVERLGEAGGLAVRVEESKLGWELSRWTAMMSDDDPWAWHRAVVAFVDARGALQSCGMHAFSLPDVRIAEEDGDVRQRIAGLLDVYQLVEDPGLRSGETFAPDRDAPRRVIERWPDTQYSPEHVCHNPYGVWRVGPPGGRARPLPELVPVFIPALAALLTAAERRQGRALTRAQVESIRDESACIAMAPRDAQAMERSRGYADLDPELAWQQWRVMRGR